MSEELAPIRRSLPILEWPEKDRAAWYVAHRRGGLLDDDGYATSWAPRSSVSIAQSYGRFLPFATETGALDSNLEPHDRVTRPCVEAYIARLRKLNRPVTVASRIVHLSRAIAVMAPTADFGWLRRIASRLSRTATGRDDRNRMVSALTLHDLGLELMQRAEGKGKISEYHRALLFRDGLLICVLAACPIRARNIAGMSIGTTVQRRGPEWWVCFGPGETKTGPFEKPLPVAHSSAIETYLTRYRTILVRRSNQPIANDALWISKSGRALAPKGVGLILSSVTKRELSRNINPHLFRKIAQTDLAIHDPAHVGIGQHVLDHASYRMGQEAYNLARSLDAARRYQDVVRSIRDESGAGNRDK
jgi:integrase